MAGLVFDPRFLLNIYTCTRGFPTSVLQPHFIDTHCLIASHDSPLVGRQLLLPSVFQSLQNSAKVDLLQLPKTQGALPALNLLSSLERRPTGDRQPCRTLIETLENDSFLRHISLLPAGDLGRK
jgi:hypothetical protein